MLIELKLKFKGDYMENAKKIMKSSLLVVLLLSLVLPNVSLGAGKYVLNNSVKVYQTAAGAKSRTGSTATYQAGTYNIYKSYDGMLNISRSSGPGAWINPADNKTVSNPIDEGKLTLTASIKIYQTAIDAKNRTNPSGYYQAGTYNIYKKYDGMLNISKYSGPGAWINPADINATITNPLAGKKVTGFMATAVRDDIVLTWEKMPGAEIYEVYQAVGSGAFSKKGETSSDKFIMWNKSKDTLYRYYVRAKLVRNGVTYKSNRSYKVETRTSSSSRSTIKNFLQNGLAPMGSTMYVWGGAWNEADTGSGPNARILGLYEGWRTFANKQTSSYNHWDHQFEIMNGLDCSGFLAWVTYNTLETKEGNPGYVSKSTYTGQKYKERGLGTYNTSTKYSTYRAGDVMYTKDHVYIVIGKETDGSVLLMHSSPNGPKLGGTPTPSGKIYSKAYYLARDYMKEYFPAWYAKHPKVSVPLNYLTQYKKFKFYTSVLGDPDGYKYMSPSNILKDLFKYR